MAREFGIDGATLGREDNDLKTRHDDAGGGVLSDPERAEVTLDQAFLKKAPISFAQEVFDLRVKRSS